MRGGMGSGGGIVVCGGGDGDDAVAPTATYIIPPVNQNGREEKKGKQ